MKISLEKIIIMIIRGEKNILLVHIFLSQVYYIKILWAIFLVYKVPAEKKEVFYDNHLNENFEINNLKRKRE